MVLRYGVMKVIDRKQNGKITEKVVGCVVKDHYL